MSLVSVADFPSESDNKDDSVDELSSKSDTSCSRVGLSLRYSAYREAERPSVAGNESGVLCNNTKYNQVITETLFQTCPQNKLGNPQPCARSKYE